MQWLSLSELIAPCYLTIGEFFLHSLSDITTYELLCDAAGSNHGEGAIITRDRRNEAQLKAGGGSETEIVCSSRLNLLDGEFAIINVAIYLSLSLTSTLQTFKSHDTMRLEKGLLVQVNMDHWSEDDNDDIMDSKYGDTTVLKNF